MKRLLLTGIAALLLASTSASAQSSGPGMGFFSGVPVGTRVQCTAHGKVRCCTVALSSGYSTKSCHTHASEELAAGRNSAAWRRVR